ncbi:MAG: hypothetical protein ACRD44_17460 [Bryobacteraceae bacterium]
MFFTALLAQGAEERGGEHADNTIYWKLANFAILAGALGWAIWRNAPAFFRGRTERIQVDIRDAGARKAEADERVAAIDRKMAGLGSEVDALRAHSRQEMQAEASRAREETARLAAKIEAAAAQEIAAAAGQARRELRAHSATVALQIAERKIGERVGPAEDAALVAAFSRQLQRPAAGIG